MPDTDPIPELPGVLPRRRRFFTFQPGGPLWWYAVRTWFVAFFGSVAIAVLLSPIVGEWDLSGEIAAEGEGYRLFMAMAAVTLAPPIETLMMAGFFGIATYFSRNAHRLSLCSGLLWGALHLSNAPVNAIAVVWPFYIMSRVYLAWRTVGFWKAFGVTTLIHTMINVFPALGILFVV